MRAVLFNGSPRKNGNTQKMLETIAAELKEKAIKTEIVQIGGRTVRGCLACYKCVEKKNNNCIIHDDINSYYQKMLNSDIIIIGSPTYFADITSETKALIDRCGMVAKANGNALARKIGAAVVPARRSGEIHAFNSINHFFLIGEMIVPGSTYWNVSLCRQPGDYEKDEEGINTMKKLAENIAWLNDKIVEK